MVAEQTHRYPRWMTLLIEVLCTLLVGFAACLAGRDILLFIWTTVGLDLALATRFPWLTTIVLTLGGGVIGEQIPKLSVLLPSLSWLLLALLLALLARNSLPTVRTSPRGMLIEFCGDWLAIPWESVTAIKVTEDFGAERFVLLAETNREHLTGWHRLYSFLYRFGIRRGFLITSAIGNFDGLVQTLLSETDRVARVLDRVNTIKLQEDAQSPLFRLLLGPASFFSRRDTADATVDVPVAGVSGVIRGTYPARISALFTWGTTLLAVLMLIRYLVYWLEFLAIQFPGLRPLPVFNRLELTTAQAAVPWWLLVAAHLMVVLMLGVLVALRHTLPQLEVRGEGLAVQQFSRWHVVPWSRVSAIKVTELTENSQVVLFQATGGLPFSARLASLLYEGTFKPGVLLTSALSNFEAVLQRMVLEVTRHQNVEGDIEDSPLFQSETYSPLLFTSLRAAPAIDRQVEDVRESAETTGLQLPAMLRAASPMAWVALFPALLVVADHAFRQGVLPTPLLIIGAVAIFLLGMLEWPVVALAASAYDDATGGGEEGNRPFYLYPPIQLPRVIPLAFAVILALIGVPFVPMLLWLAAIAWSFLLAAGLWSTLYDWRGSQLVIGGMVPVIFQLLVMLAFLFVR